LICGNLPGRESKPSCWDGNPASYHCATLTPIYVVLSFKINLVQAKAEFVQILSGHLCWLEKLGTVCNPSKTEIMILGKANK